MKYLIQRYWLEALLLIAFIVFTFIIPIRIVSFATSGLLVLGLILTVINDERIQDPYSSILGIAIFIAYGLFVHRFW